MLTAPHWGTKEWANFELATKLSRRMGGAASRLINDAEMQGLAVIKGKGLELVVTLGTGAGTALFRDGEMMPHLELAHHPIYKKKTYNDYIGDRALKKAGKKHWNKRIACMIGILYRLLHFDRLFSAAGTPRKYPCACLKIPEWCPMTPVLRGAPCCGATICGCHHDGIVESHRPL